MVCESFVQLRKCCKIKINGCKKACLFAVSVFYCKLFGIPFLIPFFFFLTAHMRVHNCVIYVLNYVHIHMKRSRSAVHYSTPVYLFCNSLRRAGIITNCGTPGRGPRGSYGRQPGGSAVKSSPRCSMDRASTAVPSYESLRSALRAQK